MIIQPPKTLDDFKKIKTTILKLLKNPYADEGMIESLNKKLEQTNRKIKELE